MSDKESKTDSNILAPVLLEIQIGLKHKFTPDVEQRFYNLREEICTYLMEKYGEDITDINGRFYEYESMVEAVSPEQLN